MESLFSAVTDLGDVALTGTFTLIFSAYLFASKEKRPALAILAAFIGAALAIALGKITIYSRCDLSTLPFDLRSPSGHSAIATAVYGTASITIASSLPSKKQRLVIYALTAFALIAIVVSRVILGYHTASDAVLGLSVGIISMLGVRQVFLRATTVNCRWWPLALIVLPIFALLYGAHFPAEAMIKAISLFIHGYVRACGSTPVIPLQ